MRRHTSFPDFSFSFPSRQSIFRCNGFAPIDPLGSTNLVVLNSLDTGAFVSLCG